MFKTKLYQLAFPAYLICVHMVLCHMTAEGLLNEPNEVDDRLDITNYYHLYNQRSGMHVEIRGEIPYANSTKETNYTILEVKSRRMASARKDKPGQVALTLMGKQKGRFLCFTKKGKLFTRFSWNHTNCLFEESVTPNGYIEFHVLDKASWKLGFNRKGKPIKATSHPMRHAESCVKFVKLGGAFASQDAQVRPGPVNSSDVLAESARRKEHEVSSQARSRNARTRIQRRRRKRRTTPSSSGLAATSAPSTSPVPLVRIRRQNQELLRTLRLLKLLE